MAKSAVTCPFGEISIYAIGRPCKLGQFYDGCNGRMLSGKHIDLSSVTDTILNPDHLCLEIRGSPDDILSKVDIEPKTKLNIMLDLIKVEGGLPAFLKDVNSKDPKTGESYLQLYQYKSEQVKTPDLQSHLSSHYPPPSAATHIVQKITYGCCSIIWMDDEVPPLAKKGLNNFLFENIPKISIVPDTGQFGICLEVKDVATCKMYSDICPQDPCNNFIDSLQHFKYVQSNLPVNAMPVQVTLFPIKTRNEANFYQGIGNTLANRALHCLRSLRGIETRCLELQEDPEIKMHEIFHQKIIEFGELIIENNKSLYSGLRKISRKIKERKEDCSALEVFLDDAANCPFNARTLNSWLDNKKLEWGKIKEMKHKFPNLPLSSTDQHQSKASSPLNGKHYFEFVIQLPKEDVLLKNMAEYLDLDSYDDSSEKQTSQPRKTIEFEDSCKMFEEILQSHNFGKENASLVLEESDVPSFSGSIRYYNDNKLVDKDFRLPILPTLVIVEEITVTSFKLSWTFPDKRPKNENYEITVTVENDVVGVYKSMVGHVHIKELDSNAEFKVTIVSCNGPVRSKPSQEIPIKTLQSEVTGKPGKPKCSEISSKKLRLQWTPPRKRPQKLTRYCVYDAEKNRITVVHGDKTESIISICPNISYQFTVQAAWNNGERSEHSEPSDTFEKRMSQDELRKENIKEQSTCITKPGQKPQVYLLQTEKIGENENIQKFEFGNKRWDVPEKVVMLLGATGSGKTTLVNGMANYYLGIGWDDDFRIKLASEEIHDQAMSQTKKITSYTIHGQRGYIPFSLTLVDTPGFGDTSGQKQDEDIMDQVKKFFYAEGQFGLDHIDGIGLVVSSSLVRLSTIERYIFDSILSLFGKDVARNIFPLLTFADSQKPQVLDVLKSLRIPHEVYYTFNNSALYADESKYADDPKKAEFNKMFWEMGKKNYGMFLESLRKISPSSLTLTKEVLGHRKTLEAQVTGIQQDIAKGLQKMDKLKCELAAVQQHQLEIARNENFTYTTLEPTVYEESLPHGMFAVRCSVCLQTCFSPCSFQDRDIYKCLLDEQGFCLVCQQRCIWGSHSMVPYKYVIYLTPVTKTYEDLKKKYEEAQNKKNQHENILKMITSDIEQTHTKLAEKILQVKKCVSRLKTIALKPNSSSSGEYVLQMIRDEKNEREPGWSSRVSHLEDLQNTAEFLDRFTKDGFDPFSNSSQTLEKVKNHLQKNGLNLFRNVSKKKR